MNGSSAIQKNMIIAGDALPATYGANAPQGNYGNLRTKGWEIAADFNHRFSNGLGINVNANISDAITDITKGADWNTPWENRLIHNNYATGRRYGDIYGYVTDRLFQKEDFIYDDNGNIQQTIIIWEGTAKRTNQLAGKNPVYQTYFEDGNQVLLVGPPGDVKFVDVNRDGYITPPGKNTFGDPGDQVVIGNFTPPVTNSDYVWEPIIKVLMLQFFSREWGSEKFGVPDNWPYPDFT